MPLLASFSVSLVKLQHGPGIEVPPFAATDEPCSQIRFCALLLIWEGVRTWKISENLPQARMAIGGFSASTSPPTEKWLFIVATHRQARTKRPFRWVHSWTSGHLVRNIRLWTYCWQIEERPRAKPPLHRWSRRKFLSEADLKRKGRLPRHRPFACPKTSSTFHRSTPICGYTHIGRNASLAIVPCQSP